MDKVADTFDLHPLAVEDAVLAHQRPKLERYRDTIFLVLKTIWYVDEQDAVETGEIAVFVGSNYVVTVRHGAGAELSWTRRDLEEHTEVLGHGPYAVLYSVCDRVVDAYEDVAAELETDVDEIELSVFSDNRSSDSRRIYTLKREVAEFRRAVSPLREPLTRFAQCQVSGMPQAAGAFFRDVTDHALRVYEQIETIDSLLSSAHDAHMAQISVHDRLAALQRTRRAHGSDLGPAERRHAQDLGLGGDRRGADRDRRHLRHELRPHARAALDLRLPDHHRGDGNHLPRVVPRLQEVRLALATPTPPPRRGASYRPGPAACRPGIGSSTFT
jgi:hypothetical protein